MITGQPCHSLSFHVTPKSHSSYVGIPTIHVSHCAPIMTLAPALSLHVKSCHHSHLYQQSHSTLSPPHVILFIHDTDPVTCHSSHQSCHLSLITPILSLVTPHLVKHSEMSRVIVDGGLCGCCHLTTGEGPYVCRRGGARLEGDIVIQLDDREEVAFGTTGSLHGED